MVGSAVSHIYTHLAITHPHRYLPHIHIHTWGWGDWWVPHAMGMGLPSLACMGIPQIESQVQ